MGKLFVTLFAFAPSTQQHFNYDGKNTCQLAEHNLPILPGRYVKSSFSNEK